MISFPSVLQTCGASVVACVFIDMSGVSDHLQLRLEATPSLEAAKLTLAVCTEKALKMLEAALEAENHNCGCSE